MSTPAKSRGRFRARRLLLPLAVMMAASGIFSTAVADEATAVCTIEGTNAYTPPLDGTEQTRTVTSTATLSNCVSDDGGPAEGVRSGGNIWTDPDTGYEWQEPLGTLTGACIGTTLNATYIIRWEDGTVTVLAQTTTSDAWAITAEGQVIDDVVLEAVDWDPEDPENEQEQFLTVPTTRYAGASLTAVKYSPLNPTDPLECTQTGLPEADRNGVVLFD